HSVMSAYLFSQNSDIIRNPAVIGGSTSLSPTYKCLNLFLSLCCRSPLRLHICWRRNYPPPPAPTEFCSPPARAIQTCPIGRVAPCGTTELVWTIRSLFPLPQALTA